MVTKEFLLDQLGSAYTPRLTDRLHRFAYIPDTVFGRLAQEALSENWGNDNFVLEKYLAAHIGWSVEQERFTTSDDQRYISAGWLQTRYGTPLYLVFERNAIPGRQPWVLKHANARVAASRHDRLPPWMLDCWNREAARMQKSELEGPEMSRCGPTSDSTQF